MSDVDKKIERLLERINHIPDMKTPHDFDKELYSLRKDYDEIHKVIENIGKMIEKEWCEKAWEKVSKKVYIDESEEAN